MKPAKLQALDLRQCRRPRRCTSAPFPQGQAESRRRSPCAGQARRISNPCDPAAKRLRSTDAEVTDAVQAGEDLPASSRRIRAAASCVVANSARGPLGRRLSDRRGAETNHRQIPRLDADSAIAGDRSRGVAARPRATRGSSSIWATAPVPTCRSAVTDPLWCVRIALNPRAGVSRPSSDGVELSTAGRTVFDRQIKSGCSGRNLNCIKNPKLVPGRRKYSLHIASRRQPALVGHAPCPLPFAAADRSRTKPQGHSAHSRASTPG